MTIISDLTPRKAGPLLFRSITAFQFFGQLAILRVAQSISGHVLAPNLVATRPWVRYAYAAWAGYFIVFSFFARKLLKPALEKIEAKGNDREFSELLMLDACAAGPGLGAFILFVCGGPIADLYFWSTASLILMCCWTWTFRRRLLPEPRIE
jgi:hypothetical protein